MPETKSPFQSTGIVGGSITFLLFALLGAFGFHLDKAQTLGLFDALWELKPVIIGMGSAALAVWSRLKHVDFHSINWTGIIASLVALLAALGVDTRDIAHVVGDTQLLQTKLPGIITSAVLLYGVITAKKQVAIAKATLVPMLLVMALPLCSCSQFKKLPPETQTAIKAAAIAGAQAAADAVAKSVVAAIQKQIDHMPTTP